jgi:hypothetical protein
VCYDLGGGSEVGLVPGSHMQGGGGGGRRGMHETEVFKTSGRGNVNLGEVNTF